MPRWLLAWTLMIPLACNPDNNSGFTHGNYDDTGASDDTGPTGDCPPTLGTISAVQEDYPGRGWVAEIHQAFTTGSCPVEDGMMLIEWIDGTGSARIEDPMTVGYDDEDVYIEAYDDQTGEGSLFLAVLLPDEGFHFEFELWLKYPDNSESNHAAGVLN